MKFAHLIIGTLGLSASAAARADDRLFLAGAEYADAAYYTYTGVVLPGPGRENGRGFLQRYWLNWFGYEYLGGPGRVEASAWGAEASLESNPQCRQYGKIFQRPHHIAIC